jgi:4-aminobutyrate aminotransferase-like enzyme/Ser/Thr protein kinase RdoA (MazF antagonist)
MIRTQRRPDIDPATVAQALATGFGLRGDLHPLPGERDRNFLLRTDRGERWVAKVSSPEEPDTQLEFETALLAWLAGRGTLPVAGLHPTPDGGHLLRWPAPGAAAWRVRVLSYLPGRVLADVRPRTPALLEALGRRTAELTAHLADYPEVAPPREEFVWSLANAAEVIAEGLALHPPAHRGLVEGTLADLRAVGPVVDGLPRQLVHGDLNDHNVLVDADGHVSGILDFGDVHAAPAVFELAVATAYAILEATDPVEAAARVAAGYHAIRPLSDDELDVLFPLVRARLAASVTIAASRRGGEEEPDAYLLVSERPAWRVLEATAGLHPRLSAGFLRRACGRPPCPRTRATVAWIQELAAVSPVVEVPADPQAVAVLDLSVGSPLLTGRDTDDTPAFTSRVFGEMSRRGAALGVGRYREPRGFYLTDIFAGRPADMPERRTVHMGIDLFVDAGTTVQAPLDGRVHAVRENAGRLDYGPTVILEHEAPDGPFWTLYGHLERASVTDLVAGAPVGAGEAFARVGPYPENGDWPPHLHFQIVTDLLGFAGDFPGVVAPREVEVWAGFVPDPNLLLRLPHDATYRPPEDLQARRARRLGPSLSLSYARPIHVVRGRGAALYDADGREYLDCVNNVAHVGHEHSRVVEAGRRQMGVLNTNTRYLHEAVLEYAERLRALFPDPLSTCFFVNSGSEANELALRIARTCTEGRGIVALEGGYHGNTQGLIDVSHYKFARAGGSGPPPWVRAAAMPEDFRGRYRRDDPDRAAKYAAHVETAFRALSSAGHRPAAFLAETLLSCGGQVELPPGYLSAAYAHARAAGALCIADEVQVGFGRVGSHLWGFETQGVVPDIVTLGKPMGNGHPLGAVVTSRDLAERFANGMEFFSTFGGNPVSARIGLAVLDVMRDERLQEHALAVGATLRRDLSTLMRHTAVGDVRGRGLFLGIEIVANREERTPDRDAARYVVGRMKEHGILLSTDGPDDNVVKIKPPLPFSASDAARVVETLDRVLGEDFVRDPALRSRTAH